MSASASKAKQGSFGAASSALSTIYGQRWLISYFVQRELSKSYRGSFLGFAWAFLGPLVMISLYTLIFSEIVGLRFKEFSGNSALNYGLYIYCGIMPFSAFSESLTQSTNTIRRNSTLVRKMIFPIEILPLTTSVTSMADKLLGLGVLVAVLGFLGYVLQWPGYGLYWTLVLLPVFVLLQLLFNTGLSYLFSVIGAYLPDVREALRAFVRAMFFVTPIIWEAERVEGTKFEWVVRYNPMAYVVEAFRDVIINGEVPDGTSTFWFALLSVAVFVMGFVLFNRVKKQLADLI
ncbi:MAG: ABC transporter permease [Actinomycetota bacterium]|nr:ABC transporter permease [Actinomycetota bacterium]